ncbi:MAG: hypothetical protein HZB57_04230 [Gammaproteobacteria bacterium]|nr:hypothetical protein [Gammaproteobacteria bacterium]
MLEYIFFHKSLADEFTEQLQTLSIPSESKDDDMGFVIAISDDLDDERIDQANEIYEILLAKSEDLLEEEGAAPEKNIAAITLNLNDGRAVQALVRPDLLNRILGVISLQELNEFVEAITDAVDNPDDRPICQR